MSQENYNSIFNNIILANHKTASNFDTFSNLLSRVNVYALKLKPKPYPLRWAWQTNPVADTKPIVWGYRHWSLPERAMDGFGHHPAVGFVFSRMYKLPNYSKKYIALVILSSFVALVLVVTGNQENPNFGDFFGLAFMLFLFGVFSAMLWQAGLESEEEEEEKYINT